MLCFCFGQPDQMEGVPAHGQGLGIDDLWGTFQMKTFYDSKTSYRFN